MPALPTDTAALAALVFLLGMRHGLDADHLAAIDGLTRLNVERRFARWCGACFALGHGAVVLLFAAAIAALPPALAAPAWLDALGAWISIAFLAAIGVANLSALLMTPGHQSVALVGVRSRWFGRSPWATRPAGVALVGGLFALSIDTVGQAALFGAAAGGVAAALALGGLFLLGMLLVDGLQGWWVDRLLARGAAQGLLSRLFSAAIAAFALLLAAWGAARRWGLDPWNGAAAGLLAALLLWLAFAVIRAPARRVEEA